MGVYRISDLFMHLLSILAKMRVKKWYELNRILMFVLKHQTGVRFTVKLTSWIV